MDMYHIVRMKSHANTYTADISTDLETVFIRISPIFEMEKDDFLSRITYAAIDELCRRTITQLAVLIEIGITGCRCPAEHNLETCKGIQSLHSDVLELIDYLEAIDRNGWQHY